MMTSLRILTVRALSGLSVVVFLTLVADVLWGVVTRYVLGDQATWSEEVARLLLVWLAMLGSALAYTSQNHLGVDVLARVMAPPARRIAAVAGHATVLCFVTAVMVYGGTSLVIERWHAGQVMSTLQIRQAWMYLAIPTSGLLMMVFALDAVVDHLRMSGTPATIGEPD